MTVIIRKNGGYMPANYVTQTSDKSKSAVLWLCICLGFLGAHLFYVGRIGRGFLYALTAGMCGFGWIIDIFVIANGSFRDNVGAPLRN